MMTLETALISDGPMVADWSPQDMPGFAQPFHGRHTGALSRLRHAVWFSPEGGEVDKEQTMSMFTKPSASPATVPNRKPSGAKLAEAAPPQVAQQKAAQPQQNLLERIRARAYQIHLARNGGPGDSVADWLQAEREVNGRK